MENKLLAALPADELQRLMPHLKRVSLSIKQVVYEQNEDIETVYFPESAIMSLVAIMEDGTIVEVATVGNEGMTGLPVLFRTRRNPLCMYSQMDGDAYQMSVENLQAEIDRRGPLMAILLRYADALLIQVARGSACNQLHSVQQRCARWLLMTHDRVRGDTFALTQEFLCRMLAVRRATVSEIASSLQEAGLIRYSRGKMTILDRKGLEAASCECYRVIRAEYERAFAELVPNS
jgi:CRP-like cAMP-binding protein